MDDEKENLLEEMLQLAASEPAYRPQFYQVLMNSEVYIIGETNRAGSKSGLERVMVAGSRLNIQHLEAPDGSTVVPFFSSMDVLLKSVADEVPCLQIAVRNLFAVTEGETLHLNPMSNCGKEFIPEEVADLLAGGSGIGCATQMIELDTQVTLGQPAQYPYKLVDSLTLLFAKYGSVKRAYLALMKDSFAQTQPRLIVGVEAKGDVENIMRMAAEVATAVAPEGEPVGLYRIGADDGGISEYLVNETTPFYERSWGARLWSKLGGRA